GTVFKINQQEVLRFEQSLIQEIVEMNSGGNCFLFVRGQTRAGDGFDLLPHGRESFQHQIEIGGGNLDDVDGVERGAGGGPLDGAEQSDFAEVIAAAQISTDHIAAGQRI